MMNVNLIFRFLFLLMAFVSCDDPEPTIPDIEVKNYTNPVFNPVFTDPTILDNRERDG